MQDVAWWLKQNPKRDRKKRKFCSFCTQYALNFPWYIWSNEEWLRPHNFNLQTCFSGVFHNLMAHRFGLQNRFIATTKQHAHSIMVYFAISNWQTQMHMITSARFLFLFFCLINSVFFFFYPPLVLDDLSTIDCEWTQAQAKRVLKWILCTWLSPVYRCLQRAFTPATAHLPQEKVAAAKDKPVSPCSFLQL